MEDHERESLETLVLAPYIQKATALIGKRRRVGGNQFRHAIATLAILIDYHYSDPVLLKASVIHDLFEDVPDADPADIRGLDHDGIAVEKLVQEVSLQSGETKPAFLARLRDRGSDLAKVLKVADRISNLTDLHETVFTRPAIASYLDETAEYVRPMAVAMNLQMAREVDDLLVSRRDMLRATAPADAETS